jgi:hypothetical protein
LEDPNRCDDAEPVLGARIEELLELWLLAELGDDAEPAEPPLCPPPELDELLKTGAASTRSVRYETIPKTNRTAAITRPESRIEHLPIRSSARA